MSVYPSDFHNRDLPPDYAASGMPRRTARGHMLGHLTAPMFTLMRETRLDSPVAVPPSRAIAHAGRRLLRVLQSAGPDAIAFGLSAAVSAETRHVIHKFARGSLRSAKVLSRDDALQASDRAELKAVWLFGHNHDADALETRRSLFPAELVILQDETTPETGEIADVFFPVSRGTSDSPEKPDWWWVQQVALVMGFRTGLQFTSTEEITHELVAG